MARSAVSEENSHRGYHAYQVCLLGALPEVTSFAGALRDGLLPTVGAAPPA